ncbi:hypothetical protein [Streptomyces sp. NPDC005732]|uniref:hypothetical protein n=1 Tax=Streptomyces sp. NPDC005732 TaxID=3157057 RepID=UPI0033D87045
MADHILVSLAWLAAITAVVFCWAGRPKKQPAKKAPAETSGPRPAVIEIVEKGRATDDTLGGGLILPNDVRINGQSLLVPKDTPIKVHEIEVDESTVVCVTLTLFARRVTIAAEGDL